MFLYYIELYYNFRIALRKSIYYISRKHIRVFHDYTHREDDTRANVTCIRHRSYLGNLWEPLINLIRICRRLLRWRLGGNQPAMINVFIAPRGGAHGGISGTRLESISLDVSASAGRLAHLLYPCAQSQNVDYIAPTLRCD